MSLMSFLTISFAVGLFVGMVLLLELGRRHGQRRQAREEEGARAGLGAVEGAVFALMGLLVAFTFSSAANRLDVRRQLIVDEANAIGTAWLRLDLLPTDTQPELRELFRRYLDARLAVYRKLPDFAAARAELDQVKALQGEIWSRATKACRESSSSIAVQLIPALNAMFDIAATRTAAIQIHQPVIIFIMLGVLALMSALLAGYAMAGGKSRSWIHVIGFALILAMTVYVILDLEFPRAGMIRIDSLDQLLVNLRQTMN
ncbi:MAG: DUF4239 domain-containing protein [Verrucomicrobiota bacterium]